MLTPNSHPRIDSLQHARCSLLEDAGEAVPFAFQHNFSLLHSTWQQTRADCLGIFRRACLTVTSPNVEPIISSSAATCAAVPCASTYQPGDEMSGIGSASPDGLA